MWIDSSTSDPPEAVRRHSTQCRWVETKPRRRWWRQLQGSTTKRRWCRQWRHVGNTCRLTVSIILCNNNCEVLVTRLTCNNSRNDLAFTRTTKTLWQHDVTILLQPLTSLWYLLLPSMFDQSTTGFSQPWRRSWWVVPSVSVLYDASAKVSDALF